jgi:hypothetical protein
MSTEFGEARITRGGAWNSGGLNNDVATIPTALPSDRLSKVGFRLARAALADGAPVNLSGVITVRIVRELSYNQSPKTLAPREVVQYSVQKGDFTVEAHDAQNESVVGTGTFKTARSDRWNLITVAVSGSRIVVSSAPEGTFF